MTIKMITAKHKSIDVTFPIECEAGAQLIGHLLKLPTQKPLGSVLQFQHTI